MTNEKIAKIPLLGLDIALFVLMIGQGAYSLLEGRYVFATIFAVISIFFVYKIFLFIKKKN